MAARINLILALGLLGSIAMTAGQSYIGTEIGAWHFHTYFFERNTRSVNEVEAFRRELRRLINTGSLEECSLNRMRVGWDGPHPVSQFEMCCNATSFNAANSWIVQNHGNLSVFVHPLTEFDQQDHVDRVAWIGEPVILDNECPCLYPFLPKPRHCPVYPGYPDEVPTSGGGSVMENFLPIPGTEDYQRMNKNFNILTDDY